MLVESARIARGKVRDVAEVKGSDVEALIFPGGFGAAKNLCDFAVKGAGCTVNAEVARLVEEVHDAGKPIGFICISPAMAAKIFADSGIESVKLTIGNDKETAEAVRALSAEHVDCTVGNYVVDEGHKIVTTPAYMLAQRISEAAEGIDKLVNKVLELA